MSSSIIKVENLGKKYILGQPGAGLKYERFSEKLIETIKNPFEEKSSEHAESSKNEFWALRNVSFEVKQGEVLGIIGRNGAGKSTLLKILSRITEPTEGRITLEGRVASLLEVGTGFHPELTGRENIYLNGAILGMTRAEIKNKFDEIVAFAEVERFLDTPVKRYSSGMYVRLAFAVAAHLEPEILVVDEVLAVGDAEFQKKCLGKMSEVALGGRTVLFVSHNLGAVRNLCEKVMWIDQGEIRDCGPPLHVINCYVKQPESQENNEISKDQHVRGTLSVEIKKVILHAASEKKQTQFLIGERICVKVIFSTHRNTKGTFWLLIIDSEGTVVSGAFQKDCNCILNISDSGYITAYLENINLLPGTYSLSVGLLGRNEIVDWVDNASSFQIMPQFEGGQSFDNRLCLTTHLATWIYHQNEK